MSYDLKIYTVKKQNFKDLLGKFDILINSEGFTLPLKKSQIVVSNEMQIEEEDIPTHPIVGWWWNGFPRKSGLGLVIGSPLLSYVEIKRDYLLLDNGCMLFLRKEDDTHDDLYRGIKIQDGILQPEVKQNGSTKVYGFTGRYPKIWPFEGPKAE